MRKNDKKISFKSRKIILTVLTLVSFLSVVLLRVVWVRAKEWQGIPFFAAVMVLLVVYLVLTLVLWRCPFCGKYLGKLDFGITTCKHCERALTDANVPKKKRSKRTTK